jgi:hypothetical protein
MPSALVVCETPLPLLKSVTVTQGTPDYCPGHVDERDGGEAICSDLTNYHRMKQPQKQTEQGPRSRAPRHVLAPSPHVGLPHAADCVARAGTNEL